MDVAVDVEDNDLSYSEQNVVFVAVDVVCSRYFFPKNLHSERVVVVVGELVEERNHMNCSVRLVIVRTDRSCCCYCCQQHSSSFEYYYCCC